MDLCFELAQRLTERLAGVADVVDEVHGFRSFDERDLLGFVDGTENPEGGSHALRSSSTTKIRTSSAAATSSYRSTFTILGLGTHCPSRSKSGQSAVRSSLISKCPTK